MQITHWLGSPTATNPLTISATQRVIQVLLGAFVLGLVISGLTAFPLVAEVTILEQLFGTGSWAGNLWPALGWWISFVFQGLTETNAKYPFMLYGTDWLAFAHVVIAIAFIGPLRDPVRNIWVVEFGMIACFLLVPLALICGPLRGIPPFWIAIDCSFGMFGIIPLVIAYRHIKRLIALQPH